MALTLEQLQGKVAVALERVLCDASGRRFDDVHKQLFFTREGRRLLSAVRMAVSEPALVRLAAAAKGTEPTAGFTDSTPDGQPTLTKAQEQAIRDLLTVWGLSADGIARVLQEVNTTLGVERLAEALNENAATAGGTLDENMARSGGIGAARSHAGLHQLVRGGILSADEAEAEAAAQQAEGSFGGGGRSGARVLNLRMQSGRNAIEKAMSLVRSRDKSISFDDCWVQACELVRRARADGLEIRT